MKISKVFIILCLIYQALAGGPSFTTTQPVTAPSPDNRCVDCEVYYKQGVDPSEFDTCDPGDMRVCRTEAVLPDSSEIVGFCAGAASNPYSEDERSSRFVNAGFWCFGEG